MGLGRGPPREFPREPNNLSEAQKCPRGEVPLVFVPVGTPGDTPPIRNELFM